MSPQYCLKLFISSTAHHLTDHCDFILFQNLACCSLHHCVVITLSSITVHPSLSCGCDGPFHLLLSVVNGLSSLFHCLSLVSTISCSEGSVFNSHSQFLSDASNFPIVLLLLGACLTSKAFSCHLDFPLVHISSMGKESCGKLSHPMSLLGCAFPHCPFHCFLVHWCLLLYDSLFCSLVLHNWFAVDVVA